MIKPCHDYILVKKTVEEKEIKQGTIILPTESEKNITYDVIETGEDVKGIEAGNKLCMKQYYEEIPVDKRFGDNLVLVKYQDVIAIES